jgi:electron transfer flavoprotein beta subunit
MKIIVLLKMVPDVVEELEVSADGRSLNADFLRMILSERDNHALEQALLLKERCGGTVTAVAPDAPEVEDALFTALAKGADRAVKIPPSPENSSRAAAALLAGLLPMVPDLLPADLILTGCQATDDLDGLLAPMIAQALGWPYIGLVTAVEIQPGNRTALVLREFTAGTRGEFDVPLPAVLGVQAAEKPPRYVPVAKVRAAMKGQSLFAATTPTAADGGWPALHIARMAKPQTAGHAEILEGSPEEIAARIGEILAARGVA